MRILLDESLPRELARELVGHSVRTVVQMGWSGLNNGELLRLATDEFNVFLTADQNLGHQQNVGRVGVGVVVLVAINNRIGSLRPLVPHVLGVIATIQPGEIVYVSA